MIEKTYTLPNQLSKLHDELLAAEITPTYVHGEGDEVTLTFDAVPDDAVVQAVVDAHDPTPAPAPPSDRERIAALEAEVQGMKDRAAAKAAESSPTAKEVAQAVVGDAK